MGFFSNKTSLTFDLEKRDNAATLWWRNTDGGFIRRHSASYFVWPPAWATTSKILLFLGQECYQSDRDRFNRWLPLKWWDSSCMTPPICPPPGSVGMRPVLSRRTFSSLPDVPCVALLINRILPVEDLTCEQLSSFVCKLIQVVNYVWYLWTPTSSFCPCCRANGTDLDEPPPSSPPLHSQPHACKRNRW